MKNETGICYNCGVDQGLHQSETMKCPRHGIEETRFNKLEGKFYPQQWTDTIFEDSGLRKLQDAAPELLRGLNWFLNNLQEATGCVIAYHLIEDNPNKEFTNLIKSRHDLAKCYFFDVIKKATS